MARGLTEDYLSTLVFGRGHPALLPSTKIVLIAVKLRGEVSYSQMTGTGPTGLCLAPYEAAEAMTELRVKTGQKRIHEVKVEGDNVVRVR